MSKTMLQGHWALPVKRELSGPAPGWTDYKNIHILDHLTGEDERIILTHESAHVWLKHDIRSKGLANKKLSTMAQELEIARCIYTDDETYHIKDSITDLAGGMVRDSIPRLPSKIVYLEDIYEWLVANVTEDEIKRSGKTCCGRTHEPGEQNGDDHGDISDDNGNGDISDDNGNGDLSSNGESNGTKPSTGPSIDPDSNRSPEVVKELLKAVKKQLASIPKKIIYNYRPTKSFIATELEAINAGARRKKQSYARPSRRTSDELSKGTKRKYTKPKVIIYLDRSGSFTPAKTAHAANIVKKLLKRYEATIESALLYFTNGQVTDKEPTYIGDTPYGAVVASINLLNPALAIVVTDDDEMDTSQALNVKTIVIPVCQAQTKFAKQYNLKEERV